MRGGDTASGPDRDELTARVFRALHQEFDLRTVGRATHGGRRGELRGSPGRAWAMLPARSATTSSGELGGHNYRGKASCADRAVTRAGRGGSAAAAGAVP